MTESGPAPAAIRLARPDDVPVLVELRRANAERHAALDPVGHRVPDREPVRRYFTELLRAGAGAGVVVLVAEVSGTVAGMTELVLQLQEPPGHQIHVHRPQAQVHTVILPGFRGRGIGTALVKAAERLAAERGVVMLVAPILAPNAEAVGFYSGAGFGPHGVILTKELAPGPPDGER